jgi:hypothetical protein
MKLQSVMLNTFSQLPMLRTLELLIPRPGGMDDAYISVQEYAKLLWEAELAKFDFKPIPGLQYVEELVIWVLGYRHVLLRVEGQPVRYCECRGEEM